MCVRERARGEGLQTTLIDLHPSSHSMPVMCTADPEDKECDVCIHESNQM